VTPLTQGVVLHTRLGTMFYTMRRTEHLIAIMLQIQAVFRAQEDAQENTPNPIEDLKMIITI